MSRPPNLCLMARYSAFLGRRVEVHYRAGDILLPASGTFVADSGRSIFLEQHFEQRGQQKNFRWEIPYRYIVSLEEKSQAPEAVAQEKTTHPPLTREKSVPSSAAAAAAADPLIPPLHNRPKTA